MENSSTSFLDLIQARKKGKLKLYLGMIAGVGKTYRMLQEAHELISNHINVTIGIIETHNRKDTESLRHGIPEIPLKKIFYKGHEIMELDLDMVIDQHPDVVIIDELAHSNAPGSKNPKRWQDVLEIINAGINVVTAMNVQHFESSVDRVEKIAGIAVSETVPDRILFEADEIVNIDLPAEDLIKRMKDGKIYKEEQIENALKNYFQPEKIIQLRDLALRKVASQLEKKIKLSLPVQNRIQIERFMGCISTNFSVGKKIVRKTARLADHYQAEWFILYVKTPKEDTNKIDLKLQRKLLENMRLAKELGATILMERNSDIPKGIFNKIQELQITNVLTGKPDFSLWRQLTGRNYFGKLLKLLRNIEIDVIVVF